MNNYKVVPVEPTVQGEPTASPTSGMNLGQRIQHVGGRETERGTVEFGSVMAVEALVSHVLRDIAVQGEPVYLYRYRGLQDFVTCNHARYAELSAKPHLFETKALYTLPQPAEQDEGWPTMPDKFYEGLGWMHAECCAALDRGEDPRTFEVGDMVNRCIRDLTRPQPAEQQPSPDVAGLVQQHYRDSAELRRLCQARDEQRDGRLAALERAAKAEAEVSALVEALETLLEVRVIEADANYGLACAKAEQALAAHRKQGGEA